MLRVQNSVFLLLCLQYILYEGTTYNIDNYDALANDLDSWKCESNADCSVERSTCVDGTCRCATGFIYSGNMTTCIKVATSYGDDCTESIQCSRYLYSGGICMNAACVCAEGYYYLHGRCNAYSGLHEKCHKDDDCYINGDFNAMSCVNGICECSSGYYQREYRNCRPAAKGVGDKCIIDNDCKQFNKNALCDYGQCTLSKEYNPSYKFLPNNNNLEDGNTNETDAGRVSCKNDEDCGILGEAICGPLEYCVCKRTYFYEKSSNKCISELGEPCHSGDTIHISNSECRNGKWSCALNNVVSADSRECEKVTKQYEGYCSDEIPCYLFGPDGVCRNYSDYNTCVCNEKSRYIKSESYCWGIKGIGETCYNDIDCYINNGTELSCKDNLCSCTNGTRPNSNRTACIHTSAGIGFECEVESDCSTNNAKCENSVCTCKDGYYLSDDQCLPGVNSPCNVTSDCKINNTQCVNSSCICQGNYVAASNSLCVPMVSVGRSCEYDIQCSSYLPNTVCSSRYYSTISTCECVKDYHYKFNKCFKRRVLGKSCMNLGECYLDSGDQVVCRNGLCACDWGYIQVNDTVCEKIQRYNINGGNIRTSAIGLIPILLLIINFLI